jgi:hypothetical protein
MPGSTKEPGGKSKPDVAIIAARRRPSQEGKPVLQSRLPPSVSGKNYRLPLDHPQVEAVGHKLEALYQGGKLCDEKMLELIKLYRSLIRVDRYCSNRWGASPLPNAPIRPGRPDAGQLVASEYFGLPDHEVRAGFVYYAADCAAQLEADIADAI